MGRKKVRTPGGEGAWWKLLPEPYDRNPDVVVVYAPKGADVKRYETTKGDHLGLLINRGKQRGLQILEPKMALYPEHAQVFREYGVEMVPPQYIGPISDVPTEVLTRTTLLPLVFVRDAMWRPFLNLRAWAAHIAEDNDGN